MINKSEQMHKTELGAIAKSDFNDAINTLLNLYQEGLSITTFDFDLIGGLNYIEGKKDACFVIVQYLKSDKKSDTKRIRSLIKYHEQFQNDKFHQGVLDVLNWAISRLEENAIFAKRDNLEPIATLTEKMNNPEPLAIPTEEVNNPEPIAIPTEKMNNPKPITKTIEKVNNPEATLIPSEGKRFINFVIDEVLIFILMFLLSLALPILSYEVKIGGPVLLILFFLYYFLFESFLQKTPAKYLTGTKVVMLDGSKPGMGQIAIRSICRLIPFYSFSAIGTARENRIWWHDRWSGTRVLRIRTSVDKDAKSKVVLSTIDKLVTIPDTENSSIISKTPRKIIEEMPTAKIVLPQAIETSQTERSKTQRPQNYQKNTHSPIWIYFIGSVIILVTIIFVFWQVNKNNGFGHSLLINAPAPTALGGGTGKIAFTAETDEQLDIYLMDADGSNVTRLTTNPEWQYNPVWSPDGSQIAYLSYLPGNNDLEIFIMNADGSNQHRLTYNHSFESHLAWSPDGKSIAFTSDRDEPNKGGCENTVTGCNTNIYLLDINDLHETRVTNAITPDFSPSWSPDDSRIVYSRNFVIFTINSDGSNSENVGELDIQGWDPEWSPDGTKIVFFDFRDGGAEIFSMNLDGTNMRRLTDNDAYDDAPDWSPDGKHIAFHSNLSDGTHQICIMDSDGAHLTCLKNNFSLVGDPAWQPFTIETGVIPTNDLTFQASSTSTQIPLPTDTSIPVSLPTQTITPTTMPTTGIIMVRVFRSDTNQPISNASIELNAGKTGEDELFASFNVNNQGRATIEDLPPGTYSVTVWANFVDQSELPCFTNNALNINAENWLVMTFNNADGSYTTTVGTFSFDVAAGDVVEKNIDLVCH